MFNFTVVDIERRPTVLETLAPLSRYGSVTYIDPKDRKKIFEALPDTDVFIIRLYPTDRELLSLSQRLKAVIKAGVGVDHIDVAAATEMGIHVANKLKKLFLISLQGCKLFCRKAILSVCTVPRPRKRII